MEKETHFLEEKITLMKIKRLSRNNFEKWNRYLVLLILAIVLYFGFNEGFTKAYKQIDGSVVNLVSSNNYRIFKGVFYHTINQTNLFDFYPNEYFDKNHYGPFFSIIIAPFAIFPDNIGIILFILANTIILLWSLKKLPFSSYQYFIILLLLLNDIANSAANTQINPSIAAMIILAFLYSNKGKEFWATFFIFIGMFIKLYTIVGLVFIIFSPHKIKFIAYSAMWSVLFFVLPMLISSPSFIFQSYIDWFHELVTKNNSNALSDMQDVCIQGFFRRIFSNTAISNSPFILGGFILYALPFLRFKQFKRDSFKYMILAITLIFPVIFSSSSESSTYIIAIAGFAIWVALFKEYHTTLSKTLIFLVILFSILSVTDLFPYNFRTEIIYPYKIKVISVAFLWLYLIYQMLTFSFQKIKINSDE
jgi:hypothetical protein